MSRARMIQKSTYDLRTNARRPAISICVAADTLPAKLTTPLSRC